MFIDLLLFNDIGLTFITFFTSKRMNFNINLSTKRHFSIIFSKKIYRIYYYQHVQSFPIIPSVNRGNNCH